MKKTVRIPSGRPSGRLVCPSCGNSKDFVELARNVTVSTLYRQNDDGSFSPVNNDTELHGDVRLLCSTCGTDMSSYHSHFFDMIF